MGIGEMGEHLEREERLKELLDQTREVAAYLLIYGDIGPCKAQGIKLAKAIDDFEGTGEFKKEETG